jgi:histidine triad (HIT) family protein
MPSIFTQILNGDLPGRIVHSDDQSFALMTTAPIRPGHTLIIPKMEIDHWLDLPPGLAAHLFGTAQKIGHAIQTAFKPVKVGMMIAGLEVRHTHLHLIPIHTLDDLNPANQNKNAQPEELDKAAEILRNALRTFG